MKTLSIKTFSMPADSVKSGIIPCACCRGSVFKPALNCEDFSFVRCASCGLVQRNPQPDKAEIIARYSSVFGSDYLTYELENEAAFLKLQQLALRDAKFDDVEKTLFRAAEPPSVIDVGCATGALLAYLRDRNWRVTGVEISPCCEYAQKERRLDVRNIPLEEIRFPQENFDLFLASHLIEHLNNPASFLAEANRVLKKGGRVFITTPNIRGFQARLCGGKWRSAIFDHLYLFSARTLSKMLIKAGFKIERIRTWGGLAAGLAPVWLKKPADFLAKRLGFGDVMIIRAEKINLNAR